MRGGGGIPTAGGAAPSIFKERGSNKFTAAGIGGTERTPGSMQPPPPPTATASRPTSTGFAQYNSPGRTKLYSTYASHSPLKRSAPVSDDDDGNAAHPVKHARRASSPDSQSHTHDGGSYYSDEHGTHDDEYDELADEDVQSSVSPPSTQPRGPSPSQEARAEAEMALPQSDGTIVDDYYLADQHHEYDRDEISSQAETEVVTDAEADQTVVGSDHAQEQDHYSDATQVELHDGQDRLSVGASRSTSGISEDDELVSPPRERNMRGFATYPTWLFHFMTDSLTIPTLDSTRRSPSRTCTRRLRESLRTDGALSTRAIRRPGREVERVSTCVHHSRQEIIVIRH